MKASRNGLRENGERVFEGRGISAAGGVRGVEERASTFGIPRRDEDEDDRGGDDQNHQEAEKVFDADVAKRRVHAQHAMVLLSFGLVTLVLLSD